MARRRKNVRAQPCPADDEGVLGWAGSMRNAWCSGEMRRYQEELLLRRQHTGALLTLRHEGVGIEQELIPR